jgi:hypothetical protein
MLNTWMEPVSYSYRASKIPQQSTSEDSSRPVPVHPQVSGLTPVGLITISRKGLTVPNVHEERLCAFS